MQIWTFWEPREKMPYCWQLCIETWKKFLPYAEIVLLDSNTIRKYIDVDSLGPYLPRMPFMLQTDIYRVMLLKKYGGIWLDADTMILSDKAREYFVEDRRHVTFFGELSTSIVTLAFIKAAPDSIAMKLWLEFIKNRLDNMTPGIRIGWDFFGNNFIDDYAKNNPEEIYLLDRSLVFDELPANVMGSSLSPGQLKRQYIDYYFLQTYHIEEVPQHMLFLHNSWTPEPFKNFGKDEFLRCNFTMANLLMGALDMKRNRNLSPFRFVPVKNSDS